MKNDSRAIDEAFEQIQKTLDGLGLMRGIHGYLWQIELTVSLIPAIWNNGFFFHQGTGWADALFGYEDGVIYIRSKPSAGKGPGESLKDLIAHEYGHAWAWLDEELFTRPWFKEAFGANYFDGFGPGSDYYESMKDKTYREFLEYEPSDSFATPYALYSPAEDFAETFMLYCREKGRIKRFKWRLGLYKKLLAIKKAIRHVNDIEVVRGINHAA